MILKAKLIAQFETIDDFQYLKKYNVKIFLNFGLKCNLSFI